VTVDSIAFGEAPGKAPWCRLKPALLLEQNVLGKNAVLTSLHVFCFCSPQHLIAMATRLVLRVLGCPAISSYPQTGAQQPRSNEEDLSTATGRRPSLGGSFRDGGVYAQGAHSEASSEIRVLDRRR